MSMNGTTARSRDHTGNGSHDQKEPVDTNGIALDTFNTRTVVPDYTSIEDCKFFLNIVTQTPSHVVLAPGEVYFTRSNGPTSGF